MELYKAVSLDLDSNNSNERLSAAQLGLYLSPSFLSEPPNDYLERVNRKRSQDVITSMLPLPDREIARVLGEYADIQGFRVDLEHFDGLKRALAFAAVSSTNRAVIHRLRDNGDKVGIAKFVVMTERRDSLAQAINRLVFKKYTWQDILDIGPNASEKEALRREIAAERFPSLRWAMSFVEIDDNLSKRDVQFNPISTNAHPQALNAFRMLHYPDSDPNDESVKQNVQREFVLGLIDTLRMQRYINAIAPGKDIEQNVHPSEWVEMNNSMDGALGAHLENLRNDAIANLGIKNFPYFDPMDKNAALQSLFNQAQEADFEPFQANSVPTIYRALQNPN